MTFGKKRLRRSEMDDRCFLQNEVFQRLLKPLGLGPSELNEKYNEWAVHMSLHGGR